MLGVDEGDDAAERLRLGEDLERERGLARGLRSVDLHDAPTRHAADAERGVEGEGPRGYGLDLHIVAVVAELHDRAAAELLDDLRRGGIDHLLALLAGGALVYGLGGAGTLRHPDPPSLTESMVNEQLFVVKRQL